MKLRIKGVPENTLRLRLLRSELESLAAGASLEETLTLSPGPAGTFTYTLSGNATTNTVQIIHTASTIHIVVPQARILHWTREDQVGIYEKIALSEGRALDLLLEKDFACLDTRDPDAFPNPKAC